MRPLTSVSTTQSANAGTAVWLYLFAAWVVALIATLGALFIGEVMGQVPCTLCWYQRIFMFPLAIILAVACYHSDLAVLRYALPLAAAGWLFAAYHMLLYARVIPETLTPCSATGPSCASADMSILGGMPLPLLSVIAFSTIVGTLALTLRRPAV